MKINFEGMISMWEWKFKGKNVRFELKFDSRKLLKYNSISYLVC